MNKMDMKSKTAEAVRQAISGAELAQSADVMQQIPELMECVELDREDLRSRVQAELNRKSGNPVNSLLALVGLRLVSTRKAAEEIDIVPDGSQGQCALKVDLKKFTAVLASMARKLALLETSAREEKTKAREESSRIFWELDQRNQENEQLAADLRGQRAAVVERCQYILSLLGPEDSSAIARQMTEMLEEIGVTAWWEEGDAPYSGMFTQLRCDDPESRRIKPCMTDSSGVLVKGLRFCQK